MSSALRRQQHVAEVCRLDPVRRHRDHDLAVTLETPSDVEDRDADEVAALAVANAIPFIGVGPVDSSRRVPDVQVEDVDPAS